MDCRRFFGRAAIALPGVPAALFALLAACGGQQSQPPEPAAAGERPANLLLVTLDTTRFDHLGSYGREPSPTPRLDRLAARGTRFEQAIAPVALTRPAHATLLTGRLPHRHGVWSNGPYRLDPGQVTLAERFRAAGFRTAAVVASFVLSRSFGLAQGFEIYDDATREIEGGDPEKTAGEVSRATLAALDRIGADPFFLWIHFYDPHVPFDPPRLLRERFPDRPYDAEIAYMDREIGRVLDRLEADGRLAETLVVAVADHGEGLGEHGETTHGYLLYDSTVRVPLILAGPGAPRGTTIFEQVVLADLAPTLLEAFGLAPGAATFDGRSFWRGLGSGAVGERPAVIENRAVWDQYGWAAVSGVRTRGWKWLGGPGPELYDLERDPGETRNLVADRRDKAAELRRLWKSALPDEVEARGDQLSPEEEAALRSLGYVSGGPTRPPAGAGGADPKAVAGAIAPIEALIDARRAGREAEIETLAAAVLAIDPGNLYALRVRGHLLVESRKFEEAVATLAPIVEGHETHPETLAHLGLAHLGAGRPSEAVGWLERASTPPWIYWPALESLARISARQPQILPRARLLAKLDPLAPESARERLSLARAFAILAEPRKADGWFRQSLDADPGLVEASVGLAQMKLALGEPEAALSVLSSIPEPSVESVFVTGTALRSLERGEEACDAFRRAMGLAPRNANLLFGLGRHLSLCGEPRTAADAFRRALEREPGHAESLYHLARLEEAAAAPEEARALYRRFLAVSPPALAALREDARRRLDRLGG